MKDVSIFYICDLTLCNFDCGYCVSGIPGKDNDGGRSRTEEWYASDSPERFRTITGRIAQWPFHKRIRLGTIGEGFVSNDYLAGVAQLAKHPTVRFVELVTNGSLVKSRLPKLLSQHPGLESKLSLWMTFHHTEIALEKYLSNLTFARDTGVSVVANALLFPDNVDLLETLQRECDKLGVRSNVDVGYNFNDAYATDSWMPGLADELWERTKRLVRNHDSLATNLLAVSSDLKGQPCSAGHDYFFVNKDGGVFRCLGYNELRNSKSGFRAKALGSALDPTFVPRLRAKKYAPCAAPLCKCKEDFLHLQTVHDQVVRDKSIGWCPPSEDATKAAPPTTRTGSAKPAKRRLPVSYE